MKAGDDIGKLLELFRSEVAAAADTHFLFQHINRLARDDREVNRSLNANPRAWETIQYSLRISSLTIIGRIFDSKDDKESLSIHTFLRKCTEHAGQFSKEALEARMLKNHGADQPGVRELVIARAAEGYEPNESDFRKIVGYLDDSAKIYESKYKPIRNKIIAHRDMGVINDPSILELDAKHGEIDEILRRLLQVYLALFQLFANGRLMEPSDCVPHAEGNMTKEAESLMQRLVKGGQ